MACDKTVVMSDVEKAGASTCKNIPVAAGRYFCKKCGCALTPEMPLCPNCGSLVEQETSLEPGTVLNGKYRLLNVINSGGFGDIYLCHPVGDTRTRYILKVLQNYTSSENQERFGREARILKMLKCPVIVEFIDYWVTASCAYIVMEYVDGDSLNHLVKKYDIDEETTLRLALEVARALRFAWDTARIIHRDIKPSNIMVNSDMEVRVLDFGIAKQMDSEGTIGLTANNVGLGTPGYMSPEQYKDARDVDFRSDIYSLGATMYFLLKKAPVVNDKNFLEAYQHVQKVSPPPRSSFFGVCSSECAELIRSMMELDKAKRPASYDVLINQLKALVARFDE